MMLNNSQLAYQEFEMNRLCIHKAFVFEPKTRTMIILNYIKLQEKNKSLHFT